MNISEFDNLEKIKDINFPFVNGFIYQDATFYIEPIFMTQLQGFKEQFPNRFSEIIEEMFRLINKNKKIVFTGDYLNPIINKDNFIYLEITDVTDRIQLFAEDKSRGSDYGD